MNIINYQINKDIRNHKVLIVQTIVPHYVLPFFKQLSLSKKMNVTVAYGQARYGSSLQNVSDTSSISTELLENIFLFKKSTIRYQRQLISIIKRERFDTVILEFDLRVISNFIICLLAKQLGIKIIWWGHGIGPSRRRLSKILRLWLCRFADAIIFYDGKNAKQFISWGVPNKKVFIAWNSIDTDEIKPLVKNWDFNDRYRILYVGRLIPEKKVNVLIMAFAQAIPYLIKNNSRLCLTIIGEGPERNVLESLVKNLGVQDYVEFIGELYIQKKLAKYFNSAIISVSPGYIGLNAIHSMAYGVPMLVSDNEPHSPEICAIKKNDNALLFHSDDVNSLAQQLIRIATEPEMLTKLSSHAVKTINDRFSIKSMVEVFEEAIEFVNKSNLKNRQLSE